MKPALDVHVLVLKTTPPEMVQQCLDSLKAAADNAGFKVTVRQLEGIPGELGKARKAGYALGTATYVTHVDDDDYVSPDAFSKLAGLMAERHELITTGENMLFDSGRVQPAPDARHHLAVYRRQAILPYQYERFKFFPDQYLMAQFTPAHINECLYYHRIRQASNSRAFRFFAKAEAKRELEMVHNPALFQVELMSPAQIAAEIDKELE